VITIVSCFDITLLETERFKTSQSISSKFT